MTTTPSPARFPFELSFQAFGLQATDRYRHTHNRDHVERTLFLIGRGTTQISYPMGNTPLRGIFFFGAEKANVSYRSVGFEPGLELNITADSQPTFYLGKGIELFLLGSLKSPGLARSKNWDLSTFVQGEGSLFSRQIRSYDVVLKGGGLTVDMTSTAREHITKADYQFLRINAGATLRYRRWRRFQPYGEGGYSRFLSALFIHLKPGGMQLLQRMGLDPSEVDRFDFNRNLGFLALGARSDVFKRIGFSLEAEGMRISHRTYAGGVTLSTHVYLENPDS